MTYRSNGDYAGRDRFGRPRKGKMQNVSFCARLEPTKGGKTWVASPGFGAGTAWPDRLPGADERGENMGSVPRFPRRPDLDVRVKWRLRGLGPLRPAAQGGKSRMSPFFLGGSKEARK